MRAARFRMSHELLCQLMHLPAAAMITSATLKPDDWCIEFVISDPSLPDADGPHDADPIVTREEIRWDWNVKS